jgi:hypothetical protein
LLDADAAGDGEEVHVNRVGDLRSLGEDGG